MITVGKLFQGSALLYRSRLAPDPALISGTFSGATVAMAVGRRIIEKLTGGEFLRTRGAREATRTSDPQHLADLAARKPGRIRHVDGVGAMIAFRIDDGALAATRAFIKRAFQAGLALYYGGHEPACVRLFLPAGVLDRGRTGRGFRDHRTLPLVRLFERPFISPSPAFSCRENIGTSRDDAKRIARAGGG